MLAKAHRPRLHLVADAARVDGVVDDPRRVEEDVEGVVPVGVAQCRIAHLMVNSRVTVGRMVRKALRFLRKEI